MTTDERATCGEPADRRGFFRCGKPANHYGERHTADVLGGDYTWGYVPADSARADHPHTDPGDGRSLFRDGGIVRSDVTADNPGSLGNGCMFSDVARVFVLPDRTEEPK